MGIVNRTPDSFYDGGVYVGDAAARARVRQLVFEGADIIDVGAESTRPGAPAVDPGEQIQRLGDIIPFARREGDGGVEISVDTTSPEVAEHAARQGARMINSVALSPADDLAEVAVGFGASLVLTHCRASNSEMVDFSTYAEDAYDDVIADVVAEWHRAAARAKAKGLTAERILFDPGLGFTKSARHSLALAARLDEVKTAVAPHRVLVGASRKSYVARAVADVLGEAPPPPGERLGGSIAATLDLALRGADVLRVHDVGVMRQALAYSTAANAVRRAREGGARA